MKQIPQDVSESVRRRNPHLYGMTTPPAPVATPKPMLRQKQGPKMNKTEAAFLEHLQGHYGTGTRIRNHAVTYQLANGVRYTPDFVVIVNRQVTCFEVKGAYVWDDAKVKVKVAASVWPEIEWVVAWKVKGEWLTQVMQP